MLSITHTTRKRLIFLSTKPETEGRGFIAEIAKVRRNKKEATQVVSRLLVAP
jgi:hypothetical protein